MKNYNKILEAINRGIHLALDDYEDEIQSHKVGQYKEQKIMDAVLYSIVLGLLELNTPNTINIDPLVKKKLGKLYKSLVEYLKIKPNAKFTIWEKSELKHIIKMLVIVDPKVNLNWIDTSKITNMSYLFDDFFSKNFCGDVSEWDTSNVTMMVNTFNDCSKFNCDISKWDVSNVEKMTYMFGGCEKFNLPIGNWNVGKVWDMSCMFSRCKKFNQDISKWDVSNVKDMDYMFHNCKSFNCDISDWDVHNVISMRYMFLYCEKFDLNLNRWDVSNVKEYENFSHGAKKLESSKWGRPNFVDNTWS